MKTYDFTKDARTIWQAGVVLDYIVTDHNGAVRDVHAGSLDAGCWLCCELCGNQPVTHVGHVVVIDACDGGPTLSRFRLCLDCWADARREGTLLKSLPTDRWGMAIGEWQDHESRPEAWAHLLA